MLTQCGLSFFGQALNNTSERSEVSILLHCSKILHIQLLTLAPSGVDRWFAVLIESYD